MIPSYFKIEILAIQDEFVLLGHKGLTHTNTSTFLNRGPKDSRNKTKIEIKLIVVLG